ncbi:MAG: class I SAM-dependent RNA methyltransferase [Ilumatobacter sp.]|nr:class I SAM-dependent RNA methyltransferase [Ilumatobacter sp.]
MTSRPDDSRNDASDTTVLRPERFIAGGEAMAHEPDGKVVFVRGGIPGDEVAVTTTERKGGWSRAVVDEVMTAGPERVEAPCPQRRRGCGGCDWQELAVDAQLRHKVEIVRDAFRRTAKLPDATITAGAAVPSEAYRTTVRVVGGPDGRASYRADRSHDVVHADGCLIAHPSLRALIDTIEVPEGLEVTLRVSAATGERTARWDRRHGDVRGLPPDVAVGSDAFLTERVAGHRFRVSAGSFFQSGNDAAQLLVDAVRRLAPELEGAGAVLDAYAGVGLFAVAATDPSSYVVTVESSRTAVADAAHNLAGRRASVELGQVGRWRRPDGLAIDVAIADPARSGLGRPGAAAVVSARAPVVVVVSCDPVAAARDAALLHQHGYRHDGTEVLDLFPHTHHVECVTRFVAARLS